MASKDFFEEPREWSVRKHRILEAYLKAFSTALSRQAPKGSNRYIYYIDCFAGAGIYSKEDGSKVEGSPVLAARTIKALPYQVKCINVESDPQHFASLAQNTEAYKEFVTNLPGHIHDHLHAILREIADNPALFFLDPFGIIDIPITGLVDAIAQRRTITDALIRYDPTIVRRLCGRARQDPKRGLTDAANLDRIFAGSEWRSIVNATTESTERDRKLLSLYASMLINIPRGRFRFVASYEVRTLDDKLKYFLLLATGNKLGIKIMSDILYEAEKQFSLEKEAEQARRAALTPFKQLPLFEDLSEPAAEESLAYEIDQVATTIIDIGKAQASWTYEDLYYELILSRSWFGRMSYPMFRQATIHLEEAGKLIKEPGPRSGKTRLTIIV